MIWDYWLDESHEECGHKCASPIHGIFEAYVIPPSSQEPMTKLDKILVHMFEIRMDLEFSRNDILAYLEDRSDPAYRRLRIAQQHMPPEFHKFRKIYGSLLGLLEEKESISHLVPVAAQASKLAEELYDSSALRNFKALRDSIMHQGGSIFGVISKLKPSENTAEYATENSLMVCAGLINTFVDGLMHVMPSAFCSALGKTQYSLSLVELYDPESFRARMRLDTRQNPIRYFEIDSLGDDAPRLASDLIRLRWASQMSITIHELRAELWTASRRRSEMWRSLRYQKILHYTRRLVRELYILVELCKAICDKILESFGDDNAIKWLLSQGDEIGRLRNVMEHRPENDDNGAFSAALKDGIGIKELLHLGDIAFRWVCANADHYQDTHDDGELYSDLDEPVRGLDFDRVDREVAEYRKKAHEELKMRDSGHA